jgi:hypothetical protein
MPVAWMSSQVRAIGTLNNFLDQVLIGAILTPATLAMYNLGKRVDMAQIAASQAFVSTLYQPRFAAHQGDGLSRDFRKAMAMMTFLFGVPSAVLVVHADTVVSLIFGAQWMMAAPVVQAMAIGGYSRVIANVQGLFFYPWAKPAAAQSHVDFDGDDHWPCGFGALDRHGGGGMGDHAQECRGVPVVGAIDPAFDAAARFRRGRDWPACGGRGGRLGGGVGRRGAGRRYGWMGTVALWAMSGGAALLVAGWFIRSWRAATGGGCCALRFALDRGGVREVGGSR